MITNNLQKRSQLLYTQSLPLPQNSREALPRHANLAFARLSDRVYETPKEILEFIDKHSNSNGVENNLPSSWIQKIPEYNRGERIKQFYKDFNHAVKGYRHPEIQFKLLDSTSQITDEINQAFHKSKILPEDQNIKLLPLTDDGGHARTFLLDGIKTGKNEQLVIKIFYTNQIVPGTHSHGCHSELNKGSFWLNTVNKKINPPRALYDKKTGIKRKLSPEERELIKRAQRTKFMFGDGKAGYVVNCFIPADAKKPVNHFPEELVGLSKPADEDILDNGQNKIQGWGIDYGGMQITNHTLVKNKTARWVCKKLYKTPVDKRLKVWNEFYTAKKYKKNEDIKAGLAASLFLLQKNEQVDCFKKLALNATNKIKEPLAYFLDLLPEDQVLKYFKQFLTGSDNNVLVPLAKKMELIKNDEKEYAKVFKQIVQTPDTKIKKIMIDNLKHLPHQEIVPCFKLLVKNSKSSFLQTLAIRLGSVPEDCQADCLIEIAKVAAKTENEQINKLIERKIRDVPKKDQTKCYLALGIKK